MNDQIDETFCTEAHTSTVESKPKRARKRKEQEAAPKISCLDWARILVRDFFTHKHVPTLVYWREDFYRWDGTHYVSYPKDELFALVLPWIDAQEPGSKPRRANEIIESTIALTILPAAVEAPVYRKGEAH